MEIPEILWGMDPLFHVPLQLMIFQVKALQRVQGVYYHHTHAVRNVEIMGMIQLVHRRPKFILYNVDDGTGAVQCIMWIPDQYQNIQDTDRVPALHMHELGQVIRVVGQPSEFKGHIQVTFHPGDAQICTDPNDETIFRLRVLNMERSIYSKPVRLPDVILSKIAYQVQESSCEERSELSFLEEKLLRRVTDWVLKRIEFCYLELEDDEDNNKLAHEVVKIKYPGIPSRNQQEQAHKMIRDCLKQLISEGVLEYISIEKMILHVVKPKNETIGDSKTTKSAVTTKEQMPGMDGETARGLINNPIVLDESEDEFEKSKDA
ncbi:CST complex subunit STN1 [Lobosporangium transversale]|uniref:CST complex subunit STN1 n=1 Tax=Lobosporangium transversale TaxID=64571 RepID=A0A1Y2GTI9_9FUNG|nr:hypothetical protein BCR41DRAFT_394383 [Lobosporangium transversale]KAF9899327.1 CST complex subunit STN1 [Lobosporangium transversale]ORZ22810.1 hypothetical protein BCR41DRAFT_394383 [Lobosporangium transversale]|eukprot:XP_021883364.1 hypothetical protein BCR41DRAFT_394383 [Lobosporangium transversale]